jgi:putative transposase
MFDYRVSAKNDELLRMRIVEISKTRIRYGFWRIIILLRGEGFTDNHKRTYRIYKEEGLNLRTKRPRRNKAGAHRLDRVENNSLNKVLSMDFVQDALLN